MRHLSTLIVLLGYAVVHAATPVLPPSFPLPARSLYSVRDELHFTVRVVPHPSIRTLRVELWELEAVPWSPILHFDSGTEFAPADDAMRYEPRECIRSSDEPLTDMLETKPRTIYPIKWRSVPSGRFEIRAKVLTNRNTSVSATRRIQVS